MTRRNIIFRPAAEADLIDPYHSIAERSGFPARAIGYIRRIRTYCETLATFPERGTRRDDLRYGLRIIGFERRIVIAYMILGTGEVDIGRIFYGGQDYEDLMREAES